MIRQGGIYWLWFRGEGSEPSGRHPAVVVQDDRFNRSGIQTTVVAQLTSMLRRQTEPGNTRLGKGEANLPRPSVVNVTQLFTVDRSRLTESIGTLSRERTKEVLAGLGLVFGLVPPETKAD